MRRIIGWSLLGLLGLVGVAAIGLTLRQHMHGKDLEEALARSDEDKAWLEGLPKVEPELRDRAWAWMKTDWPSGFGASGRKDETWYLQGEAPPEKLLDRHEAERAHMLELSEILESDGPVLSSIAWLEPDLSRDGHGPYGPKHIPNILSVRGAMRWYGIEAMLAEDPAPALEQVDRLFEALQPVGSMIDALILAAVDAQRDRIHLRALYRGVLEDDRYERWLAEPSRAKQWHIDAYRAERLVLWEPLARDVLLDRSSAKHALYGASVDAAEELDWRMYARKDLTRVIAAWRLYESYVREQCDAEALDVIEAWEREGGRTLSMSLPGRTGMTWALLGARANHRLARMVARTLRAGGPAPDDLPAEIDLRAAGRFDVDVHYERLAADRVRFYVPRTTSLPALVEDERTEHHFHGRERRVMDPPPPLGSITGYAIEVRLPR
ncbi:MAG: hypothetical protein QNJ98_01160 [Planctomycetota bacterium]|nr:hypothetical protein [Planctomycetota bacterium]